MTTSDDESTGAPTTRSEPGAASTGKLERIRKTVGMVGPVATARLLARRVIPHDRLAPDRVAGVRAFDAEHGVETTTMVPPSELGIVGDSAEFAVEYSPTSVESFAFMMDRIGIDPARYAFVDIGCGKGLPMLLASNLPFRKIVGVEASHQLCEIARSNLAAYESPGQRCTDLELYEGNALDYPMPEQDTVYYLCNPFGSVVLEQFLDRLEDSLRAHPRHIVLVYDNPDPAYATLDAHPVLRAVEKYDTVSDDYTWCHYENAIHRGHADDEIDAPTPTGRGFFDGAAVPFEPDLTPRMLLGRRNDRPLPFPFDHPRVAYTVNGSAALHQAAEVLGLEPTDTILCPAYNCGHEIHPFLRRGLDVTLFDVGDDLLIDIDDLRRRIDERTKAVLVTHYFGFPQPLDEIRAICDEHDLHLIEDCAHALWSGADGQPLGTVGDVAVFSMRKSLPIASGGAVVVNNERLRFDLDLREPSTTSTWNKIVDRWLMAFRSRKALGSRSATVGLAALLPLVVARKVAKRLPFWSATAWYDTDGIEFDIDADIYGWGMADVSHRLAGRVDADRFVERRRHNFGWLARELDTSAVTPVHTSLAAGVSPWLFPVVADEPEALSAALHDAGITAPQLWLPAHDAIDWDEHPREMELKRRIIALPIHQDIDERQLRLIVDAVRDASRSVGAATTTAEADRSTEPTPVS